MKGGLLFIKMVFVKVEKKHRGANLTPNTISIRKSFISVSPDLASAFSQDYVEYYLDEITKDFALCPSDSNSGFKISPKAKAPNGAIFLTLPSSIRDKMNFGSYQVKRDKKFMVLKGALQ